jgi:adenine-specific DNA methylase
MRYIGNKTKLLAFIGSALDRLGVSRGRAADPFAGTASVAQYLKSRGFATYSSDIMMYSYVFQRAYVELDRITPFARVLKEDRNLGQARAREDFQANA